MSKFVSIADFKAEGGFEKISIIRNPKTGKLFAECHGIDGTEVKIKVQQDLDPSKPVIVLVDETPCIINGQDNSILEL